MASTQLQPVPQPLGIFQGLMARQPQTLVVKELGDSFDIKTADKRPWMRVDAKFRTLHGRKKTYDATGNHLYDIVQKNWHWHTTFAVEDEKSKKEYMKVQFKTAWFKDKVHATFTTASGTPVKLEMKGRSSLDVVDKASGALAARVERKRWKAREMLANQQTYHLMVAPGVDTSVIVAMCICLDEKREQAQRARRR